MGFVKVQKNTAYFKRFQVKFRRRREGKTDYYQRKRLCTQRKNKYSTAKYRFVVRRTNKQIICQVVWSTIAGDKVKTEASSLELRRFGLTAGLTNYAACYCTGLLCAKRLLQALDDANKAKGVKSNLLSEFDLVKETDGNFVNFEELCEKKGVEHRPFTCFLDLGLTRATVGNRVFGAVKGAIDGGINIPCKESIFPNVGDGKKAKKNPSKTPHRDRIFGLHVQTYYDLVLKGNKEQFKSRFGVWEKCLAANKVTKFEELYKKVHAEIRKNPVRPKSTKVRTKRPNKEERNKRRDQPNVHKGKTKDYKRDRKISLAARKKRVDDKIKQFIKERTEKK